MKIYSQLQDKNIDEVDFIQLEYGTLTTTFNNAKSYKVNLDTKQLEVIYYTEYELSSMQKQSKEVESLNNRVSDISNYLMNSDDSTISSVEDTVLEIESNKISEENGGM
jgi:hypothetical protein